MDFSEFVYCIMYWVYEFDGDDFDSLVGFCGLMSWYILIVLFIFQEFGIEDGCMLLCVVDELGLWIILIDGVVGVLILFDMFQFLLVEDLLSELVYILDVVNGYVVQMVFGLN